MNDLLVAVTCYSGDVDQVTRQLDSYLHHDAPVVILSPTDAPACVEHPMIECRQAGLSGWKGDHVAYKLLAQWKVLLEYPHSWFLLHEPDSVCLASKLPDYLFERTDMLWNGWLGVPGEPGGNSAPPWFAHRDVLARMVAVSEEHIDSWNEEWSAPEGDGAGMGNSEMVAQVVYTGNIPYDCFQGFVWTYQENDLNALVNAASSGSPFLSGLKTQRTYDRAVEAYGGRS